MRVESNVCQNCHAAKREHCEFRPYMVPKGCACNPGEWADPDRIPAMCKTFDDDEAGQCGACQHEQECHPANPPTEEVHG